MHEHLSLFLVAKVINERPNEKALMVFLVWLENRSVTT